MQILLVEDNLEMATLVVEFLESQGYIMDYASDGQVALNLLEQNPYDLLLLDLNLPRVDGLEVCRQAKNKASPTPVIMLTARDRVEDSLEGFSQGADDYITKPFNLHLLRARIDAVGQRYRLAPRSSTKLRYQDLELLPSSRSAIRDGIEIKLTPIVYTLLETLLKAAPEPVSRATLEAAIYGDDLPDEDVLRYHIYHLRKLIDKPFDQALIHTLPKIGYRIE
jgi:DNA-binding response OmpR family regulator